MPGLAGRSRRRALGAVAVLRRLDLDLQLVLALVLALVLVLVLELRARRTGRPRPGRRRGRRRRPWDRRTRRCPRAAISWRHSPSASSGRTSARKRPVTPSTRRSSSSSTMIRSPSVAGQARDGLLELVDQAGLVGLAALLEVQGEVVHRERGGLVVVGIGDHDLPGGPLVGGTGVGGVLAQPEGLLGRDAGGLQQLVRGRRLRRRARRPRGRPRRTPRRPRPGCTAPRAPRRSRRSRSR